ncbi:MAG TPA: hypothetical protein VL225_16625 [Vicinamibacterales bacterium]|nr:hypothetical protein [Vicinamibacterales bacterium]
MPASNPRGGGRIAAAFILVFIAAAAGFAAGYFLGARRVVLLAESPGRDAVAYVLEARCAAGRCQSLRIGKQMSGAKIVETLSGPDEQANEISWTPDGGRVGFLVNGYQLRVFDAHSGANLGALAIIDPDGFPTSRIARGVTFSSNGAAITFDNCPRDRSGCKPGFVAVKP